MKLKCYINVDLFMPGPFKKFSWISICDKFAKCVWTLIEQTTLWRLFLQLMFIESLDGNMQLIQPAYINQS